MPRLPEAVPGVTPHHLLEPRVQGSLAWRVFWRGLPWTVPVVLIYVTQIVTSVLMGGEWNTALVVLQAVVVAVFVAIFYALALAKEKEIQDPA